jgi:hypothetical protein
MYDAFAVHFFCLASATHAAHPQLPWHAGHIQCATSQVDIADALMLCERERQASQYFLRQRRLRTASPTRVQYSNLAWQRTIKQSCNTVSTIESKDDGRVEQG